MSSVPLATSSASRPFLGSQPTQRPTVPRLWPGATIVIAGCGPSLTAADLQTCRAAGAKLLAINGAWRLALADVLYAADSRWWRWQREAGVTDADLPPLKYSICPYVHEAWPTVTRLDYAGRLGWSDDPGSLYSGGFGGYQAINLAGHLVGPHSRIVLLGYDMQPDAAGRHHFHGEHPQGHPLDYRYRKKAFDALVAPLAQRSIEVINASRRTAVRTFPCLPLAQALIRE